jgi:S1-C subfamily serine protease
MKSITIIMWCVAVATAHPAFAGTPGTPSPAGRSGPPTINIELSLEPFDAAGLVDDLPWSEHEPGGLEVTAGVNAAWFTLGLRAGDIIARVDSTPVVRSPSLSEGLTVFDVWRNGKPLQLRVLARGPLFRTTHVTEADLKDVMALRKQPSDRFATPLRRGDTPSGVRIIEGMLILRLDLFGGDIVRTIGGAPITSDAAFVEAIQDLRVGHTDMVVERDGRLITITIEREPPAEDGRP